MTDDRQPGRPVRSPEEELIPYRVSEFEARKALVLAPHPDDEVFGCGGALAQLRQAGAVVRVFIVTDGAGDILDRAERQRIAALRLEESARALAVLGGASIRAGGFEDRGLLRHLRDLENAVAREIADFGPDLVFCPSPVEIHPDHRAVAQALFSIVERGENGAAQKALPESRIAFFEVSQPIRPNFLLDISSVQPLKDEAMQAFESQIGGRDYPAFVRALTTYRRMTLPSGVEFAEGYFVLPVSVFRVVPYARICQAMGPTLAPAEMGRRDELRERPFEKMKAFFELLVRRRRTGGSGL